MTRVKCSKAEKLGGRIKDNNEQQHPLPLHLLLSLFECFSSTVSHTHGSEMTGVWRGSWVGGRVWNHVQTLRRLRWYHEWSTTVTMSWGKKCTHTLGGRNGAKLKCTGHTILVHWTWKGYRYIFKLNYETLYRVWRRSIEIHWTWADQLVLEKAFESTMQRKLVEWNFTSRIVFNTSQWLVWQFQCTNYDYFLISRIQ